MDFKVKPWKHQLDLLEECQNRDHYALFWEVGTGKTHGIINVLRQKYELHGNISTLIICPSIVVTNWAREITKFSDITADKILTLQGSQTNRIEQFCIFLGKHQDGIVITNYEGLLMANLLKAITLWKPKFLILDESHKCKDLTAKRTRALLTIANTATFRFILSGTPIVNSAFDIFSQFLILDRGETFGASFFAFRFKYFKDLNAKRPRQSYFPNWQVKYGALDQINKLIYKKAQRVKKEDCLDLPPLIRQTVEFEMADDQALLYREMERDAVAYFNNSVISADLAIKKAIRLHQITSGFVKDDEREIRVLPINQRISVLREIIESIPSNKKIIVWCVFRQNYHDIASLLRDMGIYFRSLTGDTPIEHRQQFVDDFNNPNSPYRVLMGHPAACGAGVNLTQASYSIFYSHGFSLEADLQAEARNYRGGSEIHSKIMRFDIVAKNTIDEIILLALREKRDVSETILKYMKGKTNGSSEHELHDHDNG